MPFAEIKSILVAVWVRERKGINFIFKRVRKGSKIERNDQIRSNSRVDGAFVLLASPVPTGQLPLVPLNQFTDGFWALLITDCTLSFGRCFLYMVLLLLGPAVLG